MNNSKTYLFDIKLSNKTELCLTSSNIAILHEGKKYLPYSGISVKSIYFNDSGGDHIILHGIFEQYGVTRSHNFVGAKVKISSFKNNQMEEFVTYICSNYLINDLEFEIYLVPQTIKYNKSLLQMFSKTCRANFGDKKCKINISDFAVMSKIISYNSSIIICNIPSNIKDGYFNNGKLITDQNLEYSILSHYQNKIELLMIKNHNFFVNEIITLIPTCDKKFRTCCYSFNNEVNFRGEPDIPEYNIVKN